MAVHINKVTLTNRVRVYVPVKAVPSPVWITPEGEIGSAYENTTIDPFAFSATNGTTFTYEVVAGSLPPGLDLSEDGILTGRPDPVTANVTHTFTLRVKNETDGYADRTFTFKVLDHPDAPVWVTPSGVLGSFYNDDNVEISLVASDPNNNIDSYAVTDGALPSGLVLNPYSGIIVGTVNNALAGNYTFEVTVSDTTNKSASRDFTIEIKQREVVWLTPSGIIGDVGLGGDYAANLEATII